MAKDDSRYYDELPLEGCLAFLDQIVDCGIPNLRLTGGEPLIHRDFADVLCGIVDRGLNLESIATNGMLVDDSLLDDLDRLGLRPRFDVSFDGVGFHDWMRGCVGCEARVLNAIALLIKRGFPVKVQYTLYSGNEDVLMSTAELLDSMGAGTLRVNRLGESVRWLAQGDSACMSSEEYFSFAEKFVSSYLSRGFDMDLHFWSYAYFYMREKRCALKAAPFPGGRENCSANACDSARRMVAVSFDGELAPCSQILGFLAADGLSMGNAYHEGLQHCLAESKLVECACATVGDVRDRCAECASCESFPLCGGGCRAISFGLTRDYFGKDSTRCAYFKGGYHERLLGLLKREGFSW